MTVLTPGSQKRTSSMVFAGISQTRSLPNRNLIAKCYSFCAYFYMVCERKYLCSLNTGFNCLRSTLRNEN